MENLNNNIESQEKHEDDDIPFNYRCGLLSWRPNFLQKCRSIYLFLGVMCVVSTLQTALSAGYLSSQITTLERRFSLDSYYIGVIQSFFDVGFITCAVFVSFLGSRGRIPLWISSGMLVACVGAIVYTLPEFLSPLDVSAGSTFSEYFQICQQTNSTATNTSTPAPQQCNASRTASIIVKLLFILGQLLIGSGSSPILSLGPTYIDDHVSPHMAAPLIALLYASNAMGPVFGYGLGAFMLRYPVQNGVLPMNAEPGDSHWIGAWWIGYLFLAACCLVMAAVLVFFPRRLRQLRPNRKLEGMANMQFTAKHSEDQSTTDLQDKLQHDNSPSQISETATTATNLDVHIPVKTVKSLECQTIDEVAAAHYGKNIRDIPVAVWSLVSNKIYMVVCLAVCFEMFLVNGFASFLPKYIETEYKVSNITSSLIAGGLIVPAGALGIVAGGYIMHRFKLNRKKAVLFSISGVLGVIICMVLFFLIGCKSLPFGGINKPIMYQNQSFESVLNPCNKNMCSKSCDNNKFHPICDTTTNITYFSGCHAGCSNMTFNSPNGQSYYSECRCLAEGSNFNESSSHGKKLLAGECPLQCNQLIAFVCFLVVALFLTGLTQNPILMVTMRSVQKHERSFALGFQFVILRLLAYIPSPIIFGSVIDAACVHWKYYACSNQRGDCLITDPVRLTNNLIGLCICLKVLNCLFYVVLYFILPKPKMESTRSQGNVNAEEAARPGAMDPLLSNKLATKSSETPDSTLLDDATAPNHNTTESRD